MSYTIMSGTYNVDFFGVGRDTLELDDHGVGIIDETAEAVFTRGQCHALAIALHEATSLPLIAFGPQQIEDLEVDWEHAAVKLDSERYVDITGIRRFDEETLWTPQYVEVEPDDLLSMADPDGNGRAHPIDAPAQQAAAAFSRAVIARHPELQEQPA